MSAVFRRGSVLIPSGRCPHLHIICNDPVFYPRKNANCVLLVNITSVNPYYEYDRTCILEAGHHPFVRHSSYVAYERADIFGEDTILRSVADGTFQTHEVVESDVFDRILEGFNVSDAVKPVILKFFRQYC
jgi:hypothetical protein